MWQFLREMVALEDIDPPTGNTEPPKPITDPALSYPSTYLKRTFSWLCTYHILPNPGGLNQQDKAWVHQMELLSAMKAQVQREYKVWRDAQPK